MNPLYIFLAVTGLWGPGLLLAQPTDLRPARAPSNIELRDQFDAPQSLTFPRTNITVLLIADQKGSEQVNQWVAVLKPHCGRASIRGLALLAGVPKFLRAHVRAEFQAKRKYPVLLDWSGEVCEQFGYRPGVANVLIIDSDGLIRARFEGSATEPAAGKAIGVLENLGPKSRETSRENGPQPADSAGKNEGS